ncbi:hypothetical protein FisN_22Lh049 [Fistulifera solaris]|uniref:Bifunctional lysine-specific demethylase and histidyl-hydroxylase n=1 Tax=Fistulifera solaris TaxID=1519565 RepID=A0A1Z5JBQ2_FISSO|nr:hypothetical protein FisN_22Lh049 [Fistulifera solaris]|eukprot:GAX11376.1 hypothetical protein FisN_22Lh049 [Fistulifera solaris]
MDPQGESSTGLSRAAKKRAKKKQKLNVDRNDTDPANTQPPVESSSHAKEGTLKDSDNKLLQKRKFVRVKEDVEETVASGDDVDDDDILLQPPLQCQTLVEILKDTKNTMTARQRSRATLEFLLGKVSVAEFYAKYWEQSPLFIQKTTDKHTRRFEHLLSKSKIKEILQEKATYYGRDLNVARYEKSKDGVKRRVTLDRLKDKVVCEEDPTDVRNFVKVDPDDIWTHYEHGCTIRLLCPHEHSDEIQALLSTLELEWGCMVGANAYLTPPNSSQGFAPHYDDIEAFCLQLEGKKRWKVYAPLNPGSVLPRFSSSDFKEEDLVGIQPLLDVVLEAGDMLYMPRGWIHQACTLRSGAEENEHSLHLTVSAMQQWAWADLMEVVFPEAVQAVAESATSNELRQGLPRNFLDYMGAMHDNNPDKMPEALKMLAKRVESQDDEDAKAKALKRQERFRSEAKKRIMAVANEAMELLDAACDQMGKRFISDRQPTAWSEEERKVLYAETKLLPSHLCRLARPGIARLVLEDDKAIVYHCNDNARTYRTHALSPLEFELDDAPAIEQLLGTTEPHWICVADLVHDTIEDKVGVAQALYDENILLIRE